MGNKSNKKTDYVGKKVYNVLTDEAEWLQGLDAGHNVTTRSVFVRTFHDVDRVREILAELQPSAFAYIYHDKDNWDDGKPKEPHYHILMKFDFNVRLKWLAKAFSGQQTLLQRPRSLPAAFEYLYHKNHKSKYQYDPAEIVSFNSASLTKTKKETAEEGQAQFLDDMDTLSMREMAIKYGRDYMRNFSRYWQYKRLTDADEQRISYTNDIQRLIELSAFDDNNRLIHNELAEAIANTLTACMWDTTENAEYILAKALHEMVLRCVKALRARGYNPYVK